MGLASSLGRLFRGEWRATPSAAHPRDPVLAETLFGRSGMTASGAYVTPDNARECPEVDACIGLNEDTVATIPLDLFERTSDDSRDRAVGHPLHELVHDRPNGWQTSAEWRQMMEGYRETHGNAYSRIIWRRNGVPEALEPAHPDDMRPFFFSGRVAFKWRPPGGGPERTLLPHEVLHLRDKPAQRNNLAAGQSRVTRHRETIGTALAMQAYLGRFFSNNATPKSALVLPPNSVDLTEPQTEALREQWERRHAGIENQHRIAVLRFGVDIKSIAQTNDDAKLIEAYEQIIGKIARIWADPPHLIGETTKSTSWGTGIEQQSIGFLVYHMRPKLVVWEQALNRVLMSEQMRRRFYFEFNEDALLRGDFKTRMEGYALMIQWGLTSVNEIRRLMNLSPVDGGDERLLPLNMVPASRIMDVHLRTGANPQQRADEATQLLAALIQPRALANGKDHHA